MSGTQTTNLSEGATVLGLHGASRFGAGQSECQFPGRQATFPEFRSTARKSLPLSATERIHSIFKPADDELLSVSADIVSNSNLVIQTPMTNRED
jgi:hypothetical protein